MMCVCVCVCVCMCMCVCVFIKLPLALVLPTQGEIIETVRARMRVCVFIKLRITAQSGPVIYSFYANLGDTVREHILG